MADLKRAGLPASAADCERMVGMLDQDNQGGVSFQDFARFVALLPEAQVLLPTCLRVLSRQVLLPLDPCPSAQLPDPKLRAAVSGLAAS